MVVFGSEEALRIKKADEMAQAVSEGAEPSPSIYVVFGGDDETSLTLPADSFLMDVVMAVEENKNDEDFLSPLTYATREDRSLVAICPDCKNAPLISSIRPRVTKNSLLEVLWAVASGYEIRIMAHGEAAEAFTATQCTCAKGE